LAINPFYFLGIFLCFLEPSEKYLQNPHVGVFIREYRNQRISVMGAVVKSGVYDVTGQKTILDLLSLAGGLKEDTTQFAGPLLFLIRPPNWEGEASKKGTESDEQKPKTFIINLEELLVKGDLTLNLPVLHGDVINVPSAGKVFVGGEVKRPGAFPLSRSMTLSQAITSAEGVTPKAKGSNVKIFRYSEMRTEKDIISVDVYAIQKGKGEDLLLKENDIIFVPKSDSKAFLLGCWDFFKGRMGSVYYPITP
jgi:polysaccharide export outer membrane protein